MGFALEKLGRYQEAEKCYDSVLKLDSVYKDALDAKKRLAERN
jgi:tetratricopeptide (TPR) repeat protein